MNTKMKTILTVIIFALFITGAYFAYKSLTDKYKVSDPKISGQGSEKLTENEKVKAPDFTVVDTNGNNVKLSELFGKPIVLNFWASWCPPCKSEMPHFNEVYNTVSEDVVFMMVDLVDGQRETLAKGKKYIADNNFSFPVYFDTQKEAANTYGISSIPSTLFIDKEGNIINSYERMIDEKTLIDNIELIKK